MEINQNSKILIIGMGKSGQGLKKLLDGKCNLVCWDDKYKQEGKELPKVENFDLVLVSPGVPMGNELVKNALEKGVKVIGELEFAYRMSKGSFIAITGTNGKTTTTTLVGEILKAAGKDTKVAGNIGLALSEVCSVAKDESYMVTEVSSFQLETIDTFRPKVSCILNLSPDHLDRHGSYEEYIRCKARVFENQGEGDVFVYNAEDPLCVELAKKAKCKTLAFSVSKNIPFEIKDIIIPGKHNMENALAAAAIASALGIDRDIIKKTIAEFTGVEHRLEPSGCVNGVYYINDSKGTNPDSSIKAINATPGPIILIAGGYEKNSDFTEFLQLAKTKTKHILLLGATAERIAEKAKEIGFTENQLTFCNSMKACVEKAYKIAKAGDRVLLSPACASWGMYNNFEERGREFKALVSDLKNK